MKEPNVYVPRPEIRYAIEAQGLRVVDTRTQTTLLLLEPEAAIWEMACRGYEFEAIAERVEWIVGVNGDQARELVGETLARLCRLGLVEKGVAR